MKKYKYEIILFITEAVCMIVELVASRLLSPAFGNSNVVWTSVIGIILLSSSIGNYIGGIVADKEGFDDKLEIIYIIAGAWLLLIPLVKNAVLNTLSSLGYIKIGAILATSTLFLLPSIFLGMIIPIILKIKLKDINTVGNTSGKLYSISTVGGIFGTFLGGFLLIPNMGVVNLTFFLAGVLFVISIFANKTGKKHTLSICFSSCIVVLIIGYFIYSSNIERKIMSNKIGISYTVDTQYGNAVMTNEELEGKAVRILKVDGTFESGTFMDKKLRNELVFDYLKKYDLMFDIDPQIKDVAMIGGAAYCYPKYAISHYPKIKMDVIEIDKEITEIAKKYYYLNDVLETYNKESERLKLVNEDGRIFFNNNEKKYDAILNDAFSGEVPARSLTTIENIRNIKRSLNEGGLYLNNIVGSMSGDNSRFIKAEVNTIKKIFKNVYVIPVVTKDETRTQNFMVIATDKDATLDKDLLVDLKISDNEIVFTDDYCPAEYLEVKR
ncbi:MAG: fused MFS/spermidine synthase [Clostridia bacterium]|nr:fused MFS/spermidine synthase [Clostridia bacterium]